MKWSGRAKAELGPAFIENLDFSDWLPFLIKKSPITVKSVLTLGTRMGGGVGKWHRLFRNLKF